jgi:xanthine dehydrogenase YagR molybdenum-binding subunit
VLAEEWEIARFAASLVRVQYEEEAHVTDLYRQRNEAFALADESFALTPAKPRGDATKAFAAAEVRHQGEYYIPIEHHNPMETFASTVIWEGGGKLTVYTKTKACRTCSAMSAASSTSIPTMCVSSRSLSAARSASDCVRNMR